LCIIELLSDSSRKGKWKGTATELLNVLTHIKNHSYQEYLKETPKEAWVNNPKNLSERLKRITPAMRTQGYIIDFKKSNSVRTITINKQAIESPATVYINKSFLEKILPLPYSIEEGIEHANLVYPALGDL